MDQIDPKLGIYQFYYEPYWHSFWFKFSVSLLIFLVVIVIAFIVYKLVIRPKILKAHEWALLQISKLNLDKLESREDFKNFYFSITSIMKNYLKRSFGWDLEHKTDEEIISFIGQTHLKKSLQEDLKQFFGGAQIIKFANEDALLGQAKNDLEKACHFIEATKEIS